MKIDGSSVLLALAGGGISAGLLLFSLWPNDSRKTERVEPVPETFVQSARERAPQSQTGHVAQVFEVGRSGIIVRPGERLPPLEPETEDQKYITAVQREWDSVLQTYRQPLERKITEADKTSFKQALRRLPRKARREGLRTAINLLASDNFGLIADLALDKGQSPEIIADAFDACLNSASESAKDAVKMIAQDKDHPMFVDAARVFDVRMLQDHYKK